MRDGICCHPGCGRVGIKARGYCNLHYVRWSRGKDMDAPSGPRGQTVQERFWSKVQKGNGCWHWTAAKCNGYGVFNMGGHTRQTHRVSYEWQFGEIPGGLEVDHICHNRACVNPSHLRLASKSENGQNRSGPNRNNKSGHRGVYWCSTSKRWLGKAEVLGRMFNRSFETKEEAAMAVEQWRAENMPYSVHDSRKEVA